MHFHQWKRRQVMRLLGGGAVAWPLAGWAQQPERMRQIAMLSGLIASDPEAQARVASFQHGLRELGWLVGRNLHVDYRWSTGGGPGEMQAAAKALVERKPELIVGMTTPAVDALVNETKTVPIIFGAIVDPVGRGFVSNMGRPGGNVTGILN